MTANPQGERLVYRWVDIDLIKLSRGSGVAQTQPSPGIVSLALKEGIEALAPVVLARYDETEGYELVEGLDTWLAAQRVRGGQVPAIVYSNPDQGWVAQRRKAASQARETNPLDRAEQLAVVWGASRRRISKAELARRFGMRRDRVAHYLRLLRLTTAVKKQIRNGVLSAGQARPLVSLPPEVQERVAERAIRNRWSARKVETVARALRTGVSPGQTAPAGAESRSPDVVRLEARLTEALGAPVHLHDQHIEIRHTGRLDVLEGILIRLGLQGAFEAGIE